MYFDESNADGLSVVETDSWSFDKALQKAFFTAVLLTRSSSRAETAVREAIGLLDPCEQTSEALLRGVIHTSVEQAETMSVTQTEFSSAVETLPGELHGVLELPPNARYCFIVRMLLQFSRGSCARLLNLTMGEVDQYTRDALWSLPAYCVYSD